MRRTLAAALTGLALLAPASTAATLPASWAIVDAGPRGGATYAGPPVDGVGALYVPAGVRPGARLPVAYLLGGTGGDAALARRLGIAAAGDQLSWQGTTPPFAVAVTTGSGAQTLAGAEDFAASALSPAGEARVRAVIGVGPGARAAVQAALRPGSGIGTAIALGGRISNGLGRSAEHAVRARRLRLYRTAIAPGAGGLPLVRHRLLEALAFAFQPAVAGRASRAAESVAPDGWARIAVGPDGGTVWQGVIPDRADPGHPRASLVYLPPGVTRDRHYPGLYLLHGLRGSPYSFVGGLRLAAVADALIHARRIRPFIAVMPPAGTSAQFDGEWTGPWERYVMQDVLPWSERHLPLTRAARARTLAGFSAGAYGSVDMGLRHPGAFGTLESWSGYFRSPRDGSLANATAAERLAHDPQSLLPAVAPALRAGHVRFFLSAGTRELRTLLATRDFGHELRSFGLAHVVHVTAGGHHGRTWRSVLPAGLLYALAAR